MNNVILTYVFIEIEEQEKRKINTKKGKQDTKDNSKEEIISKLFMEYL